MCVFVFVCTSVAYGLRNYQTDRAEILGVTSCWPKDGSYVDLGQIRGHPRSLEVIFEVNESFPGYWGQMGTCL